MLWIALPGIVLLLLLILPCAVLVAGFSRRAVIRADGSPMSFRPTSAQVFVLSALFFATPRVGFLIYLANRRFAQRSTPGDAFWCLFVLPELVLAEQLPGSAALIPQIGVVVIGSALWALLLTLLTAVLRQGLRTSFIVNPRLSGKL